MFSPRVMIALALLAAIAGTGSATMYEVREGDTLFLIARRELGDGARWSELAAANGIEAPWTIRVGQELALPPAGARATGTPAPAPQATAPPVHEPDASNATTPASNTPAPPPASVHRLMPRLPMPEHPPMEAWTIEEARQRALRLNIALRSQAQTERGAAADLDAERGAFDPVLSASVDRSWSRSQTHGSPATRSDQSTVSAGIGIAQSLPTGTRYEVAADHARSRTTTPAAAGNPSHVADVSVSITQPLLEGAGRVAANSGVASAEAAAEAARRTTERRGEITVAEVDAAYWTLAEAEEAERIARESLERAETLLERNLALLREGLIADVELLTAQNGVATRRESLISAILSRARAAEDLLFLVDGEEAPSRRLMPRTSTLPSTAAPPPDVAGLEDGAVRSRSDLAAARADLRAAGIRRDAADNATLPDLDLTASAGTGGRAGRFGTAWDGTSDNDEPTWSLGASLTFPLGNRADRARAEGAAATLERQRLAVAALENDVRRSVRNAHREVLLGLARLEAAGEARRLAMARLGAEEKRLEFGLGDTLRVLEAEQDAAAADLAEARARFAVAGAWSNLRAAAPGVRAAE